MSNSLNGFEKEIRVMRGRLVGLFKPDPRIYWADLLASGITGHGALIAAISWLDQWIVLVPAVFISAVGFYRALAFMHELTHFGHRELPWFRVGWDAIVGIPLATPLFMYRGVHHEHHKRSTYNTQEDAEYLTLAQGHPMQMIGLVLSCVVLPLLAWFRFMILAPLSLFSPRLRKFVKERTSAIGMKLNYRRKLPRDSGEQRAWMTEEALCAALLWGLVASTAAGMIPWQAVAIYYLVMVIVVFFNTLRGLGATHRYRGDGEQMSVPEQITDSINITGRSPLTLILAPVGLRYHALHHLFPSIPYHALGTAHRRIMEGLPEESFYRQTLYPSVWSGLRAVWRDANENWKAQTF